MTTKLEDLTLDEIALVRRGANPLAKVLYWKEAPMTSSPIHQFLDHMRATVAKTTTDPDALAAAEKEFAAAEEVLVAAAAKEAEAAGAEAEIGKAEEDEGEDGEDESDGEDEDEGEDEAESVQKALEVLYGDEDELDRALTVLKMGTKDDMAACEDCGPGKPCALHKKVYKELLNIEKDALTFRQQFASANLWRLTEALNSSLSSIFADASADKEAMITQSLDEFRLAILGAAAAATMKEDSSMSSTDTPAVAIRKGLSPDATAYLDRIEKEAADAKTALAAELTARKIEALAKELDAEMGTVAGDRAVLAKALLAMPESDVQEIRRVFKSAAEIAKAGGAALTTTTGADRVETIKDADDATQRIEKAAADIQAATPGLSSKEAYRQALSGNREVYEMSLAASVAE